MEVCVYLKVHSSLNRHQEIEAMIKPLSNEISWLSINQVKLSLQEDELVSLMIMFPTFQHDLGVTLSAVVGFDHPIIMEDSMAYVFQHFPGKVLNVAEVLLLSRMDHENHLMKDADALFTKVGYEEMATARMYLMTGLNAKKSASNLYLHRNTFNYRLKKFLQTTKLDLRNMAQARYLENWILLKQSEN